MDFLPRCGLRIIVTLVCIIVDKLLSVRDRFPHGKFKGRDVLSGAYRSNVDSLDCAFGIHRCLGLDLLLRLRKYILRRLLLTHHRLRNRGFHACRTLNFLGLLDFLDRFFFGFCLPCKFPGGHKLQNFAAHVVKIEMR